jgi:hypothetical protein
VRGRCRLTPALGRFYCGMMCRARILASRSVPLVCMFRESGPTQGRFGATLCPTLRAGKQEIQHRSGGVTRESGVGPPPLNDARFTFLPVVRSMIWLPWRLRTPCCGLYTTNAAEPNSHPFVLRRSDLPLHSARSAHWQLFAGVQFYGIRKATQQVVQADASCTSLGHAACTRVFNRSFESCVFSSIMVCSRGAAASGAPSLGAVRRRLTPALGALDSLTVIPAEAAFDTIRSEGLPASLCG